MSYSTYYQSSNMSNDNCDCDGIYANAEEALGTAENIVGRTYNTDIFVLDIWTTNQMTK
eukprot:m.342369 g.342369  ORF g.342369 m.342369 type:complete len:59 (-) comp16121_c0_seq31:658-834(-)